jgi:hypothetical protein
MAQPPIYEIDTDGTIRTDALHWEGFPHILWETLSEVGYTTPPLYEVVSFWDQGVPYARTTATVLPHPEHPEWADLSMMFFAHRGVASVDYLFRALCQPEFDRVHTEYLACRIWLVLKEAHVGNAQVQACDLPKRVRELHSSPR